MSPLTKGFIWYIQLYFPFPAYIRIAQELKARPLGSTAEHAWEVMSDNYEARFGSEVAIYNPVFIPFSNVILQAWGTLEEASKEAGEPLAPPRIVSYMRQTLAALSQHAETESDPTSLDDGDMSMPASTGFGGPGMLFNMGPGGYGGVNPAMYSNMRGQPLFGVNVHHMDWNSMDWGLDGRRGW